jgi:Tol biopolymer transport system component
MAPDDAGGYEDFRVRISSGPDRYTVRATCRGAAISGTFEHPFSAEGLELLILRTQARRGAIRAARRSEGIAAAREIGEKLYGALFDGVVGALLWRESEAVGEGLRITLELSDVPELMDLPWEYLYDPGRGHFLAFSLRTPIVRYLDVPSRLRPLEVAPPLRMLAMVSSPRDVIELNVEHEKELLTEALDELVSRKLVEVDWLENGTRQGLRQKLRRAAGGAPYHVFHYIGHGSFDESRGEGFLLFEDAHQRSDPIDGQYLGQMLYEHNSLRLAVLNACEGARAANPLNEPFAGVAASLVRNEIPAVIAMQFEITDDAAALFSKTFYEAIARGEPVDAALVQSRQDLSDADPHGVEWGTPVLFMRVDDGKIFDVAQVARSEGAATSEEPPPMTPEIPPPERVVEALPETRTAMAEADVEPHEPDQAARPKLEPIATKTLGRWLRQRRVILGSACLAIAGIAVGIATILGNGGSPSVPKPQPPSLVRNLPPGNSSQPAWKPGGTMIVFTIDNEKGGEPPRMYVADVHGVSPKGELDVRRPASLVAGSTPSLARTGRIAYEGTSGIWLTDAKSTRPTQLTHDADSEQPSWSPDGSRVVFSSQRNSGVDRDLFIISASPDDRAVSQLTRDSAGLKTDDVIPAWSPDGKRIAFIRKEADNGCARGEVWIVDADGDGSDAHQLVALSGDERHPTWSPNSKEIVFSSNVADRENYDLYSVRVDDGHRVRLTRTANDDEVGPSWGAEGILYARGTFDCPTGRLQRLWFLPLPG